MDIDINDLITSEEDVEKGLIEEADLRDELYDEKIIEYEKRYEKSISNIKTVEELIFFSGKTEIYEILKCVSCGSNKYPLKIINKRNKMFIDKLKIEEEKGEDFHLYFKKKYNATIGSKVDSAIKSRIGYKGLNDNKQKIINRFVKNNISFKIRKQKSEKWISYINDMDISNIREIYFEYKDKKRQFVFNSKIPCLNLSLDVTLIKANINQSYKTISETDIEYVGEIKSGVDIHNSKTHVSHAVATLKKIKEKSPHTKVGFIIRSIDDKVAKELIDMMKKNEIYYAVNSNNLDKYLDFLLQ
jgi:hypothetical protein